MAITTDMSRASATEAKQQNSVYILSDESKETVDLLAHSECSLVYGPPKW